MVMFYALVALCFSSGALAQMAGWGSCPDVEAMKDFNIRDIQGRWYEAGRYWWLGDMTIKCVKNDFLHGGGPGIIQMNSSGISRITGKMLSIKGVKMRVADAEEPGKLEIQMPSSNVWFKYWILGSDAHDWMVAYSCVDLESIHLKYVWIMTRQQHPADNVLDKAVKVLEKQKLSLKFTHTIQENCDSDSGSDEFEGGEYAKDAHLLF